MATYVLNETVKGESLAGFLQLMKRPARPEADLLYLSPALAAGPAGNKNGEEIWHRLLTYCCSIIANYGVQRVFASLPDGGPGQDCLKDVGFSLYTRETIYRLATVSSSDAMSASFRPQRPRDSWALQRLYTSSTPRLVQQAEGALSGEVGSPPFSWWEPDRWRGIVWEPAGEVRGAVQVHIGRAGHWLRVWGTNVLTTRELRALVGQGLRLITVSRSRRGRAGLPVYATVRGYEVSLGGALTGFGFAPYLDRVRFVKHTIAVVRESLPAALTALETRQEVAVRSQSHQSRSLFT